MKAYFLICGMLCCLLAACANMPQRHTYVTLDGDVVAPPKKGVERPSTTLTTLNDSSFPEVWPVILEDNNSWMKPKTLWEVDNKTAYQVIVPKKEMITIMLCWFDERGNRMSKEWQKITRQTLASRPLEIHITDFILYGKEPQGGVFINMRPEAIEYWTNLYPGIFLLQANEASSEIFINAGTKLIVCWREVGDAKSWQYVDVIDNCRDEYEFNGYLYDWTVEIKNKKERCGL